MLLVSQYEIPQSSASHVRHAAGILLVSRLCNVFPSDGPRVWRWAAGASHHPETRATRGFGSLLVWWLAD